MSKISKEFKQIIDDEIEPLKVTVSERKRGIGFIDEDFIEEYLKEEQKQQINDEEE